MTIREGQFIFNLFAKYYPEETEKLRGAEVDCFYDNTKIMIFIDAIFEDKRKQNQKALLLRLLAEMGPITQCGAGIAHNSACQLPKIGEILNKVLQEVQ